MDKPFCVNCTHHKQVNGVHQCLRHRYEEVSLVTGSKITVGETLACHKERSNDWDDLICKERGTYFKPKD